MIYMKEKVMKRALFSILVLLFAAPLLAVPTSEPYGCSIKYAD